MYYPNTIYKIKKVLKEKFPKSNPQEGSSSIENHILWMTSEIEKMSITSTSDAIKAGRWIGWVLCEIEHLGLWNNKYSRDIVRIDVKNGDDIPKTI